MFEGDQLVFTIRPAETVLKEEHKVEGVVLKVDRVPHRRTQKVINGEVTAKFDPVWSGIPPKGARQILEKIKVAIDVSVRWEENTVVISGTLKQINDCHLLIRRFLNEDKEIFAQLNNLRLTAKDPYEVIEIESGGTGKVVSTLAGSSEVIIATRIDESPGAKVIPVNEVNSDDQEGRVYPTTEARWFQVHPYAFRFMEKVYKKKLSEISGECLVEVTSSAYGARVMLQPKQDCDLTTYNTACSKLSELVKSVTQGMVTNELDLKGVDEDSAKVLMECIETMYPVIIDRPQEHGPFLVYGDAASVEEARRTVKGGISQQESYDIGLAAQEMAMGDITTEEVDAIVNPANKLLSHGAGLAKLIVQRGGLEIQRESDKLIRKRGFQSLHTGDAVHTVAGNLRCKFVIHAVGPEWVKHSHTDNMKLLQKACLQSLKLASKLGLSSIAIPAISSGIFGAPIDICAFAMLNAVEEYLTMPTVTKKEVTKKKGSKESIQKHKETGKKKTSTELPKERPSKTIDGEKEEANPRGFLDDIRFVLIDADSMDVFEKMFNEKFGGVTDDVVDDFEDIDDEHDDDEV
ncbi:hypothetical protein AWC38_SpisGene7993 [Stylophora pistillata]|uniref:Macro domain-containing protein n=2 Tax=Stylophora pistillata TaxID=50429 RepID=A0A2B4SFG7_STYPI|nr:hypothetical protein AWC38_SpisGene7993 [Stylophora pistillata]